MGGNVEFEDVGDKQCRILGLAPIGQAGRLLQIDDGHLELKLRTKLFRSRGAEDTEMGMSAKEAEDNRNAMCKFVYSRCFDWIVQRLNKALMTNHKRSLTIGVLDI